MSSPCKEPLIIACSCGSCLKYSAAPGKYYDKELETARKWFWALHFGSVHEEVSVAEAAAIRLDQSTRKRRSTSDD